MIDLPLDQKRAARCWRIKPKLWKKTGVRVPSQMVMTA